MSRGVCVIEGCDRPRHGHGWCLMHYKRWRNNGDPLVKQGNHGVPVLERFWQKVDKNGPLPGEDTLAAGMGRCWVWTASVYPSGYGSFADPVKMGKVIPVHRFSYKLLVGPIPTGLVLDHLCRVRLCVNPEHLEAVTQRENIMRGVSPIAGYAARTHCKWGHEFTEENTSTGPNGARLCKTCRRERHRAYRSHRVHLSEVRGGQEAML